jgi:hypothetical protein
MMLELMANMQEALEKGLRMPIVTGEMYAEFFRDVEELRVSALQLNSAHNVISPTVRELQKRFLPGESSAKGVERYHGKREWCELVLDAIFNKEDDDRASSIMAAFWSPAAAPVRFPM